jgi:hypothetical protein
MGNRGHCSRGSTRIMKCNDQVRYILRALITAAIFEDS